MGCAEYVGHFGRKRGFCDDRLNHIEESLQREKWHVLSVSWEPQTYKYIFICLYLDIFACYSSFRPAIAGSLFLSIFFDVYTFEGHII